MKFSDSDFLFSLLCHIDKLSYEETIFLKGCLYAMYPPLKDVNPFVYKLSEYLGIVKESEVKNVN